MKKIFSMMMVAALVASFAACSSDSENEDPKPTQPDQTQPAPSQGGNEDPQPSQGGNEDPQPSQGGENEPTPFVPVHTVTLTDTTVSAEGCTFDVIINCNVECVETSENPEMITTSCVKGEGDVCILTVTVAPDATYEQVVGKIVVEFTDAEGNAIEGATQEITITQEGLEAPIFNVTTDSASLEYEEGLVTFEWETNCTIGVPTIDAAWVEESGINAKGARFAVAAFNLPCDSTRVATITIPYTTATGEELTKTLTISQTGKTTFGAEDLIGTTWLVKTWQRPEATIAMEVEFLADGVANYAMYGVDETTGESILGEAQEGTYKIAETTMEGAAFNITFPGTPFAYDAVYDFKTTEMQLLNGGLPGMQLPVPMQGTAVRVVAE